MAASKAESLVQSLAMEGINLPESVVQRGIDSYVMHTEVGTRRIETPTHEKRIAAVHRGGGRYVSVIGGNGLFHHRDDRGPQAVDAAMIAKFSAAFITVVRGMAGPG